MKILAFITEASVIKRVLDPLDRKTSRPRAPRPPTRPSFTEHHPRARHPCTSSLEKTRIPLPFDPRSHDFSFTGPFTRGSRLLGVISGSCFPGPGLEAPICLHAKDRSRVRCDSARATLVRFGPCRDMPRAGARFIHAPGRSSSWTARF